MKFHKTRKVIDGNKWVVNVPLEQIIYNNCIEADLIVALKNRRCLISTVSFGR